MKRCRSTPRENWQQTVESQGMYYHTVDDIPYWDESVYYEFQPPEIDELEAATYALNDMCLKAVQYVIDKDYFNLFQIPEEYRQYIRNSWENDEHTIYGRFDFSYCTPSPPKLLEYNADTPTSLLEAAVIQWYWLKDVFPSSTQFNSIHERLIEAWQSVRSDSPGRMYFASVANSIEDYMTVNYLRDTAMQAGMDTAYITMKDIGWDSKRRVFTDLKEHTMEQCFKLYPWEWMHREDFGINLVENSCRWFEPPWKAILSNKAVLPILWELFPDSPYLLKASFDPLPGGDFVQKPIFSREGANIQIFENGKLFLNTDGPYDGPCVYQETYPLPRFDNQFFAAIGSWIVNGWACGIGIREDEHLITGNLSRFVPHIF
ncbi:MAG: glutathionylspermidine synthase family protein [Thermoguttaceae bacterium]